MLFYNSIKKSVGISYLSSEDVLDLISSGNFGVRAGDDLKSDWIPKSCLCTVVSKICCSMWIDTFWLNNTFVVLSVCSFLRGEVYSVMISFCVSLVSFFMLSSYFGVIIIFSFSVFTISSPLCLADDIVCPMPNWMVLLAASLSYVFE